MESRVRLGPRRRRDGGLGWRRRAAFLVYCVVVAGVALELLARAFVEETPSAVIPSDDPRLVYVLDPAAQGINSDGFRGPEIDRASLRDRLVIAAIGDSHTFGSEIRNHANTYPQQLRSRLEELVPELDPLVLNFGVPGYNTAQELALFETRVLDFEPDLVILQYTINDTHVCNYVWPEHPRLNTWIHRSAFVKWAIRRLLYSPFGQTHLYERVGTIFPDLLIFHEGLVGTLRISPDEDPLRAGHPPNTPDRVPARYHYMLGRDAWEHHIERFGEIARRAGVPLVATGFIDEDDRRVFEAAGFSVYSFEEAFEGLNMLRDGGYDPADTSDHFSAAGNRVVGRRLADYLHRHGLLRPR